MSEIIVNNIQYTVIIGDKTRKKKFLNLLSEYDAHAIDIMYAHGSANDNVLTKAFGFDATQNKVIITCLLKTDEAKELIDVLYNVYQFSKPNTGIAFTVLVEGFAF